MRIDELERHSLTADQSCRQSLVAESTPDLRCRPQWPGAVSSSVETSGSSPHTASLTYATLKRVRRKSHVDSLGRGFLKSSSRHSKSVASLLCETAGERQGRDSPELQSKPPPLGLGKDVESGYSSIETNVLHLPAEHCLVTNCNETNGIKVSSELPNIIVDRNKITSHFYSQILEQTVTFRLSQDVSSNEAEMMINNEKQFVARNIEKVIYELRDEILDKVAALKEEKKNIERLSQKIQDLLQSEKSVIKFQSFCNDLDIFINLSVKVELKLHNLSEEESRSFIKLKLENQKENLEEIKVWMMQRKSAFEEVNTQESIDQIIERKMKHGAKLCLGLENIKNLDNILMIFNYL